ncbi:MAG: iron ABC transporter permease [Bryobacterales bacterium]|nr:iron ABC transporter permease [Bryobacterales bacterium]
MAVNSRLPIVWCAALAVAALALTPLVGATPLDWGQVWRREEPAWSIFVQFRLARVLLAMLTGSVLALCGALFQALLRDSLATPYTLGVSSGAALGAVVMIAVGAQASALGACIGAGIVLAAVLAIAREEGRVSSFTLLLAGVAINSICGSLILSLHYHAGWAQSFSISRWLMGGIEPLEYSLLGLTAAAVFAVAALVIAKAREWDALAVGEEWAAARGVDAARLLVLGYVAGSLLTGLVTALTGPIGFVGLIVPHAIRLRWGASHRILLPCSFLAGAAFLAVCDAIARVAMPPADLPVGIVTALLGGPFFIWILRGRRRAFRA